MIQQNPFSLYDFLGYLIPGSLLIFLIMFLQTTNFENIDNLTLSNLFYTCHKFEIEQFTFFVIISYCVGHLVNFVSSLIIERYANWRYGYPSKYLLNLTPKNHSYWGPKKDKMKKVWRFITAIVIFPITICDLFLGSILRFRFFYTRPLDEFLREVIRDKGEKLINKLHIRKQGLSTTRIDNFDFNRIFAHYTFENSKRHQGKLTNYVVLYGFLRSLTFICIILFWYSLIQSKNIITWNITVILGFISYVYFMAFMKFYRRYTLENLMIIAIDNDPDLIIKTEIDKS